MCSCMAFSYSSAIVALTINSDLSFSIYFISLSYYWIRWLKDLVSPDIGAIDELDS